jgi:molybdopterin-guanine dinucleotide biosynthesis protein A
MIAAIVLAGETPGKLDPLAAAAGVSRKSLIPIGGRPMVSYVCDALDSVKRIGPIVVVGLTESDGVTASRKAIFHAGFGDILDNVLGPIELIKTRYPEIEHTVIASSDIPLLNPDIVNAFIDMCLTTRHDLYYCVVEQSVMERAFPGSGRSFRRFGDRAYAGGDLHLIATDLDVGNIERVRAATRSRKSGLAQARLLGLRTLLRFALGRLTLDETVRAAERAFGLHGRVIEFPDAAMAMDVDKPHQLALVRAALEASHSPCQPPSH